MAEFGYILHMKKRNWLEPLLLLCFIGVIYLQPISTSSLPVFWGEFNTVDGSLYAVRFMDIFLSLVLTLAAARLLIPGDLKPGSFLKLAGGFVSILLLASLVEAGWDWLVLRAFNLPTAPGEVSDKMLAYPQKETVDLSILWGNSLVLTGGLVYGLILDWITQLRQQALLERRHLEAEVNYLRSQINPHFLFNTLNNIFAITQRNADQEGSDALLRLSGLMRYMLYESTGDQISLNKEVEHLRNYRDLMLLKYAKERLPVVGFEVGVIPEACMVAPLILLPFVENAFKHGIDGQGRGPIEITLDVIDNQVHFRVINRIVRERQMGDEHPGIGLDNVKQRLELLYPSRHKLNIDKNGEQFQVTLRLDL